MKRKHQDFHDGAKDGLTPLAPLDLNNIDDFDQDQGERLPVSIWRFCLVR